MKNTKLREFLNNLSIENTDKPLFENTQNTQTLNEMPRVFTLDVNPKYIDKKLIEPMKKAIQNNNCDYIKQLNNGLHLFSTSKMFNKIYFLSDEEKVVAATMIEVGNSNKESFYQFRITKKLDDNLKGVLVDLYREISKDLNSYVFSDGLQSISSSTIWRKMFNNPSKYNIKGIKVLKHKKEVDLTSELDIWGFDMEKQDILVGIKF
jgi:hypothetical protein